MQHMHDIGDGGAVSCA